MNKKQHHTIPLYHDLINKLEIRKLKIKFIIYILLLIYNAYYYYYITIHMLKDNNTYYIVLLDNV